MSALMGGSFDYRFGIERYFRLRPVD